MCDAWSHFLKFSVQLFYSNQRASVFSGLVSLVAFILDRSLLFFVYLSNISIFHLIFFFHLFLRVQAGGSAQCSVAWPRLVGSSR